MKVIFLGAGAWGTAMAMHAAKNPLCSEVTLWSRSAEQALQVQTTRCNERYLKGLVLPEALHVTANWEEAFLNADQDTLVVLATPVSGLKDIVANLLQTKNVPLNWVWLCKGLEPETAAMPHQVIERELSASQLPIAKEVRLGVLSAAPFAAAVIFYPLLFTQQRV